MRPSVVPHFQSLQPLSPLSSCLPRRAVGAKRLGDLSHKEGFTARSRRTPAMTIGRCHSELSGHKHQKQQRLIEARCRFIFATRPSWREVGGAEDAYLAHAVRGFSTDQVREQDLPAVGHFGGHGYIFSCTVIIFLRQVLSEALELRIGIVTEKPGTAFANKLRRGPSTSRSNPSLCDRSPRRFAPTARRGRQDDNGERGCRD